MGAGRSDFWLHLCWDAWRLSRESRKAKAPIFDRISDLLTDEPPPIDSLADDKEKGYAASILRYATGAWLKDYCANQVVNIESADLARREILLVLLEREETVAELLNAITEKGEPSASF